MGKYYKASKIPMVDYGMDFPFQELTNAARYKQQRYDQVMENSNAIKNSFNVLVDPKDRGNLSNLQNETDTRINEIFERYSGDLSAPGVQQDVNTIAQEVSSNKFLLYAPEHYKQVKEQRKQAAVLRAQGAREEDISFDRYYENEWQGSLAPDGTIAPWMLETPGYQPLDTRAPLEQMVNNYQGIQELVVDENGQLISSGQYVTREDLGNLVNEGVMSDYKMKPEYQMFIRTAEEKIRTNPDAYAGRSAEDVADEMLAYELDNVLDEYVKGKTQIANKKGSSNSSNNDQTGDPYPSYGMDVKDEDMGSYGNIADATETVNSNILNMQSVKKDNNPNYYAQIQPYEQTILQNQSFIDIATDDFNDILVEGGVTADPNNPIDFYGYDAGSLYQIGQTEPKLNSNNYDVLGMGSYDFLGMQNSLIKAAENPIEAFGMIDIGGENALAVSTLIKNPAYNKLPQKQKTEINAAATKYITDYKEWLGNGGESYKKSLNNFIDDNPINNRMQAYTVEPDVAKEITTFFTTNFNGSEVFDMENAKGVATGDSPDSEALKNLNGRGYEIAGFVDGGIEQGTYYVVRPKSAGTKSGQKNMQAPQYRVKLRPRVDQSIVQRLEDMYNSTNPGQNIDIKTSDRYNRNTNGSIYNGMSLKPALIDSPTGNFPINAIEPTLRVGTKDKYKGQLFSINLAVDPEVRQTEGINEGESYERYQKQLALTYGLPDITNTNGDLTNGGYAEVMYTIYEQAGALDQLPKDRIEALQANKNGVYRFVTPEESFHFYENFLNTYLRSRNPNDYIAQ
tara:strand:+ start:1583 stop:3964 length:2382 start_codon:yes stop_codon:yes gene_type:complete